MASLFIPVALSLLVGLGNPGARYENTRHNLGFEALQAWAAATGTSFSHESRGPCAVARQGETWAIQPLTYMNLSGPAVRAWLDWLKKPVSELLVVVDDATLPLGALRLRPYGSHGGHNGLRSLEEALGTQNYARLRCGCGPVPERMALEDFVLGAFGKEEAATKKAMLETAAQAILCCQTDGIELTMNRFNGSPSVQS